MSKVLKYKIVEQRFSLEEKVGQLFMPAAFINDSEEEIRQLKDLIKERGVGGLCFFHSRASAATNYEAKKEVIFNENSFETLKALIQRYQRAAKYPLLIAIDAEWGLAMRIENTPQYPYAITLGAIQKNDKLCFEVGRNIARDCKSAGIHWNLAPVVDVNINPDNPVIGYRSFGEDPKLVTQKSLAYVRGSQNEGVLTSIKHFPGHGDTATDSHLGLPVINKDKDELRTTDLYPFQKLIDEGVDAVMVGHLSVPALANGKDTPSSISKEIIKGVLRNEMGFDGVVISDALNMHAVSKKFKQKGELEWLAFDAGNDVLCFSEHIAEGIGMILKNASKEQIEESFERIWNLKERAIYQVNDTNLKLTEPGELNMKIALESLTMVKGSKAMLSTFSSKGFLALENAHSNDNHFFNSIKKSNEFRIHELGNDIANGEKNLLIALFPPQVKPSNNFGLTAAEIAAVNHLIKTRNVVLYLFGNPFFLNQIHIKNAKVVVVAYQDFKEFQEIAAGHFLGDIEARGKLPVTIAP